MDPSCVFRASDSRRQGRGRFVATAAIECWKGTPAEFLSVVKLLDASVADRFRAWVTRIDGTNAEFGRPDDLQKALKTESLSGILAVRVELATQDEATTVVLVARNKIPGVLVRVESVDYPRSLGLAEVAYRQSMIGYVDRLGGYRGPLLMLSTAGPLIALSFLIGAGIANAFVRTLSILLAGGAALIAYVGVYRRLLVPHALALVDELPAKRSVKIRG